MAGFKAGNGAAKALVRLRIILAGEGVVREERGMFRATLPGEGFILDIDDRAGTSRMRRPTGETLSTALDLNHESAFASLMHNVDSSMASSGRIPTVLLRLADEYARACAEGDLALSSIVADGNIDLGKGGSTWNPGPAFRALSEAGRWSGDKDLAEAAGNAARFADNGSVGSPRFTDPESKLRWLDVVERWGSKDSVSYQAGAGTWVEIKTRSGLLAASQRIGVPMNEILTSGEGQRLVMEKVGAYALVDEAGTVSAVGIVHEGDLAVHQPEGAEPVEDEAEVLRTETFTNAFLSNGP